jgi:hypothetical protein
VALEGELRIGLLVNDGRVERVRIRSTRPDVARSLLPGRTRDVVAALVPRLFSICSRSQAAASELASTAAVGDPVTPEMLARASAAVSAEIVREFAWRMLLEAPKRIGEAPGAEAIVAARAAVGFRPDAPADAVARTIAQAVFGDAADAWLAQASPADLERWIDAGQTAAARFVRRMRDAEAAAGGDRPQPGVPLLDASDHAAWIGEISQACDADPDFARHPTWRGVPAETGALARQQADPLIGALLRAPASRVVARFVARLRELALLLGGRSAAVAGARSLAAGSGIAWVENARGLLVHRVRLDQDRVRSYDIVAPTEWNFHPAGALALALAGARAEDLAALKDRTDRLVHSLDPCVACQVEFDHA